MMMKKKMYVAPVSRVYRMAVPQLLSGSEKIEQGGNSGEGGHTLVGDSKEFEFSAE